MRRVPVRGAAATIMVHRRLLGLLGAAAVTAVLTGACGSSSSGTKAAAGGASSTVNIALTPSGCQPQPATVKAGDITVNVSNKDAGAVSEAELRTGDLSHILGEQENLTPGLSGGFELNIDPGTYVINCPGASKMHWNLKVTGAAKVSSWTKTPALVSVVSGYTKYVDANVDQLVSGTKQFCAAINSGSISAAKLAYSPPRDFYEHIEPVAEIWGSIDIQIDGRWQNPVTVLSQFVGFHRIEQLLWQKNTLKGAATLCSGLVKHEQELSTLVKAATYNPTEIAAGAADLINEAGTAKITGEEERYSNTDLPTLEANIVGAEEVVTLLKPYLQAHNAALLKRITAADAAAQKVVFKYKASPGYEKTGYVNYATVGKAGRQQLSTALSAYEKALSKLSLTVSAV
jgi:iron uptake system component EfeO